MFKNSKINLKILKTQKINLKQLRKIISERGFVLKKKRNFFNFSELRSLYYTIASSLVLILIFFLLPLSIDVKKELQVVKQSVDNNSKIDFQKVLEGKPLKEKEDVDQILDTKNLFEDIFSFDEMPTDTVRLSASTVKELFKDTEYDLNEIRKSKLVKPIKLSLLPEEIRNKIPCFRIPMTDDIRSLNLANAVAISAFQMICHLTPEWF